MLADDHLRSLRRASRGRVEGGKSSEAEIHTGERQRDGTHAREQKASERNGEAAGS